MTDLLLVRENNTPRDQGQPDEWTIHNALFEAHTVHARSLYAFFFQEPRKPDDAVASDYVADWDLNRPEPAAVLGTVSPRVGKEIAHLTYGRLAYRTDEERQWAFTKISRALVDVLNVWLARAPEYVREKVLLSVEDYTAQPEISPPGL